MIDQYDDGLDHMVVSLARQTRKAMAMPWLGLRAREEVKSFAARVMLAEVVGRGDVD